MVVSVKQFDAAIEETNGKLIVKQVEKQIDHKLMTFAHASKRDRAKQLTKNKGNVLVLNINSDKFLKDCFVRVRDKIVESLIQDYTNADWNVKKKCGLDGDNTHEMLVFNHPAGYNTMQEVEYDSEVINDSNELIKTIDSMIKYASNTYATSDAVWRVFVSADNLIEKYPFPVDSKIARDIFNKIVNHYENQGYVIKIDDNDGDFHDTVLRIRWNNDQDFDKTSNAKCGKGTGILCAGTLVG